VAPNYTPDCEEPLIDYAQQPWRAVTGPHLVALVRAGAVFDKGVLIERPNSQNQEFRCAIRGRDRSTGLDDSYTLQLEVPHYCRLSE
jgi:hypothetical protein